MDAPADAGASSTADFRAVSASFAPGGETDVTPDVLTRFGVSENWKAVTAVAATSSNAAVLRGIVRMHYGCARNATTAVMYEVERSFNKEDWGHAAARTPGVIRSQRGTGAFARRTTALHTPAGVGSHQQVQARGPRIPLGCP